MILVLLLFFALSCNAQTGGDAGEACEACEEDGTPDSDLTGDEYKDVSLDGMLPDEDGEADVFNEDLTLDRAEGEAQAVECREGVLPENHDPCSQQDHDEYIACRQGSCLGCLPTCFCGEDLVWVCSVICIDPTWSDDDAAECDYGSPPRCRVLCDD